jgi:hypothetical protein
MTTHLFNISMVEAANYLNLPIQEFTDYVTRGLVCYKLEQADRLFTRNELYRFKKEVLDMEKKL